MFHEHRDIVSKLKTEDRHFQRVFDKHNELHDEIEKAEAGGVDHIDHFTLEKMKKEKLKLKDEAFMMITKYMQDNQL